MPYTINGMPNNAFTCKLHGSVDIDEIKKALAALSGDERSDNLKSALIDMSAVEIFNLDKKDAIIPAAHDIGHVRSFREAVNVAFVVSDPIGKQFILEYKMLVERCSTKLIVRIFDSIENANAWIYQ